MKRMSGSKLKQAKGLGLQKRLFLAYIRKILGIKSPSLVSLGIADHEYDYLILKYLRRSRDGKKGRVKKERKSREKG